MKWQSTLVLCLVGIGLLVGAYFYGHHQGILEAANAPADTVFVVGPPVAVVPPETVYVSPNPAPAKPRPDLLSKKRVDSLIAVVADKDSLIYALSTPQGTEQKFMSKDPTGLDISGSLAVIYSPLERHFLTQITLDSVRIPTQIVTVTQTVIEERSDWKLIGAALTGGIAIGMWIGYSQ